ncbi:hypothetical protein BaRGS_00011563 [Batillaria attramentaria]|uniref:Uncharacterized protein n=1 Tax=Batillaria attramentaria TaxID=370345 RepID=A0ABD0LCS4_9CAEN
MVPLVSPVVPSGRTPTRRFDVFSKGNQKRVVCDEAYAHSQCRHIYTTAAGGRRVQQYTLMDKDLFAIDDNHDAPCTALLASVGQ